MNTLMHICCAPCANQPIRLLREEGTGVTGFWFNPNIHPYTEYQARKHTLEAYAKEVGLKLLIGGSYDLRGFLGEIYPRLERRCFACWRLRLEETARAAAQGGFERLRARKIAVPMEIHGVVTRRDGTTATHAGLLLPPFYDPSVILR